MLGCTFLWESVSVGGSLTGADHVEYLNGSPAAHLVTQQEPATPELGSISRSSRIRDGNWANKG